MCLQDSRYPDAPVTLVQFSTVLLSVVFRALNPVTLGRSTVTQQHFVFKILTFACLLLYISMNTGRLTGAGGHHYWASLFAFDHC